MPEPVLLSIAVAVATNAVKGLYELVKSKFSGDPVATGVLEAAQDAAPDSPEVARLGEALEKAEEQDPEFGERLRGQWESTVTVTQTGHVTNQMSGTVNGNVLQAGDVHGGVSF
ncbi:hypothetical protein ACFFQW_08825 [Umezawaea endophytica]|uniref:Uncharacterized protein n=1 Tax=Umezawaea endophytica TaxID=1654476 RepID=A0A9X2VGN1_9PSEU|nr:hypothetical protein [Umezawaea endophytica]MCS7476089.1 hypothetical protein [Umezawaea endophytica]